VGELQCERLLAVMRGFVGMVQCCVSLTRMRRKEEGKSMEEENIFKKEGGGRMAVFKRTLS